MKIKNLDAVKGMKLTKAEKVTIQGGGVTGRSNSSDPNINKP